MKRGETCRERGVAWSSCERGAGILSAPLCFHALVGNKTIVFIRLIWGKAAKEAAERGPHVESNNDHEQTKPQVSSTLF